MLREAENGVILMEVGADLSVTETVFEDSQPVTNHFIHVEANPRTMSLGQAFLRIARHVLSTPERLGLFIGLRTPHGNVLDLPGSEGSGKE